MEVCMQLVLISWPDASRNCVQEVKKRWQQQTAGSFSHGQSGFRGILTQGKESFMCMLLRLQP
eukprot:4986661-Amphidinium_carterae.1